ncbi:MAG TPA: HAD-IC family P-type ATPase [Tenericutes bacterium]|nr:HAD-IC family P-type ATPase [Mycoplasmatota bacterium]
MKDIKYSCTNIITGLNNEEVKSRNDEGFVNHDVEIKTKSVKKIIFDNSFTLFNGLNFALACAIFLTGSYKNLLFFGVVICNTAISTIQEIRSKKIVDKLSILTERKIKCLRNGKIVQLKTNEIVKDDVLIFQIGDQVVVDSVIREGKCEVNESFITGESEPVSKKDKDKLLSGSFIVSGKVKAQVINVGYENYTSIISRGVKTVDKTKSEIMRTLNKILKFISIIIVPLSIIMFIKQLNIDGNNLNGAIINTVASVIGMIPEGLVLLTSTVLAISNIKIAHYNALVQELYSIESLARIDTICLDKTGTLTDGNMSVIEIKKYTNDDIDNILSSFTCNMKNKNKTLTAIENYITNNTNIEVLDVVDFSSERKYSAIITKNMNYILGAKEVISSNDSVITKNVNGHRVLVLGKTKYQIKNNTLPKNIQIISEIHIKDNIKSNANQTINFFYNEGVDVKIISGDSIDTVKYIANEVGVRNIKTIDFSLINKESDIKNYVDEYNVFCRVSPFQKQEIIKNLKQLGKNICMVGDGVNDVLALKESDFSISFKNGSEAARNISKLVLLEDNFNIVPYVLMEGRKCINNIQRSASLFLCKTIYATLLALIFLFINLKYPFVPIQLTLTSAVTIGIPSLILSLENNNKKIQGKFLINVLKNAFPTAITIVFNILFIAIISTFLKLTDIQISTLSVILTGITSFRLLYKTCLPFNKVRLFVFTSMMTIFILGILGLKDLFGLGIINKQIILITVILYLISTVVFEIMSCFIEYITKKYPNLFN